MKNIVLFLFVLFLASSGASAQSKKAAAGKAAAPKSRIEYSLDTISSRLDNMHLMLNRIDNFSTLGFNTGSVEQQLPRIRENLQAISQDLDLSGMRPEAKSLQLFGILLANVKDQLEGWRNSLFRYNLDLINMNQEIGAFTHDSLIHQLIQDTEYRRMYTDELSELYAKWKQADTATHAHLDKINNLQSGISQLYFQTIDLENQVTVLKTQAAQRFFSKDAPYLWERSDSSGTVTLAARSYRGQRRIMGYFIWENWVDYVYVLLIGALFFVWVWLNFRRLLRKPVPGQTVAGAASPGGSSATPAASANPTVAGPASATNGASVSDVLNSLHHLREYPVLPTLVVMLSILPFFDLDAPGVYTHLLQLPILIILCIFFGERWPRKYFYYWLFITLLYILFSVTNVVVVPRLSVRLWMLFLQMIALSLGYLAMDRIIKHFALSGFIRVAAIVFAVLNVLAIWCNITGRLDLSKTLSTSAIFALVQVMGLMVFIRSLMEALSLQAAVSKGVFFDKTHKDIHRLLLLLSILIWVVLLGTNLNIYDFICGMLRGWLDTPRKIGSISVRMGNVLVFMLVIYVSNVLQKYVGYLFGVQDEHAMPQEGKKGSRLVMTRLILIIIGFFLAVVASGLPLDKITIVLGALGVGVGLGLQNIVNNLVSGIILIFERPFQIGDYIELNGKKGIVRDMGIRSSRLVTEEGTEIIMPNGDLLSGEVVNWTVQNNKVRIEVPITVVAGPTLEEINDIVQETLGNYPGLSGEIKPKVLLATANENALSFTIVAWVGNISQIQNLKSEILRLMYLKLKEKGIKTQ